MLEKVKVTRNYPHHLYRLALSNLPSLELRRLHLDFIWCYKIIFGLTCTDPSALFEVRQTSATRGHPYKLFKPQCTSKVRSSFFTQRVINVWNDLPTDIVNFSSLVCTVCFRRSLLNINFSDYLVVI